MKTKDVITGNLCSKVKLTKGFYATVSNEKLEVVKNFNWCAHYRVGKPTYACRRVRVNDRIKTIWMHREIAECPDGMYVDHIDGDGLNNTTENLRIVTMAQNNMNTRSNSRNATGVHGVSLDRKRTKKYRACINYNGKTVYLGRFETVEQAEMARILGKKKYHGEFGVV
jgi:hypothetical protein